jgi:hypothetical protein
MGCGTRGGYKAWFSGMRYEGVERKGERECIAGSEDYHKIERSFYWFLYSEYLWTISDRFKLFALDTV